MVAAAESSTTSTTTSVKGKIKDDFLRRCVFCDKEATDLVRADVFDPTLRRKIPNKDGLVSLPLCGKHFYKYITSPQVKRSHDELMRHEAKWKKKDKKQQRRRRSGGGKK